MIDLVYDDITCDLDFLCDTEGEADFLVMTIKNLCSLGQWDVVEFFKNSNNKFESLEWISIPESVVDEIKKHLEQFEFKVVVTEYRG